jgi:ribosomal protein L35AE/L33A
MLSLCFCKKIAKNSELFFVVDTVTGEYGVTVISYQNLLPPKMVGGKLRLAKMANERVEAAVLE